MALSTLSVFILLCCRATLVLDLDETLVHCCVEEIPDPDHTFKVRFNDEVPYSYTHLSTYTTP